MVLHELRARLLKEGFDIKPGRVCCLIQTRRITTPRRDAVGNYVFLPKHIREIKKYLLNPPRPGRKPLGDGRDGGTR
jgi:hypothetical protein